MNGSNFIRQPRKSMLGRHQTQNYNKQLLAKSIPKTSRINLLENEIFSMNSSTFRNKHPHKSMLGTHSKMTRNSRLIKKKNSSKKKKSLNMSVEISPKITNTLNNTFEKKSAKKKLETLFLDSFEKKKDSILATTLMTVNEQNESTLTILSNDTVIEELNECPSINEEPTLENTMKDVSQLMDSVIKKNNKTVIFYNNQINDLKKQINDTNRLTEEIKNMKYRLMENYNLKEILTDAINESNECSRIRLTTCEDVMPVKQGFLSPRINVSQSKQMIKEIQSTIKFLRIPRMSYMPKSSVLLTPHSMSFCIKSQYEKLLE